MAAQTKEEMKRDLDLVKAALRVAKADLNQAQTTISELRASLANASTPKDRIVEKIVDRPVIKTVEKIVDRPVIRTVEKVVEKPVIKTVTKTVKKVVERVVYRPDPKDAAEIAKLKAQVGRLERERDAK